MKLLTNEEIEFLAEYPEEIKAGAPLDHETVVRYMDLADRYVMNAVQQLEAVLVKNRELVGAHTQVKNQILVLACLRWDSENHFLQQGTA